MKNLAIICEEMSVKLITSIMLHFVSLNTVTKWWTPWAHILDKTVIKY